MAVDGLDDMAIRRILTQTRRVAVVGASTKPDRASYEIAGFLHAQGFEVAPINPGLVGQHLHGQPILAALSDATPLEMVDIFRASDQVAPVVEAAISLGARTIWMQLGVINHAAAALARAAGLEVVMDRCPSIEWRRLGLPRRDVA